MPFGLGFADNDAPPPPSDPALEQAPQGPSPGEDDEGSEEINELVVNLLPWGISVLFHVGLVLLAIFIVWSVKQGVPEEEVIIPIARLSATPGAPLQRQVTRQVTQTTRSTQRTVSRSTQQTTAALNSKVSTNMALIGVMGGSAAKSSPFSTSVAAGAQFKANFFGTGGNARRVIYLVDASGSLIDTLPFVIVELKRSISELSDQQTFNVFFFQEDKAIQVPPPGLKKATSENKERVIRWIDTSAGNIVAKGQSSPLSAMQQALKQQPQLLFILSDNITGQGIYEVDQRRLLAEVTRANTSNTKINTIQFLYPDPLTKVGMRGTLEQIANQTGGIYKFVDGRELNLE